MKFDVIIIGGGPAGCTAATALQKAGLRVAVVSAGLSLSKVEWSAFRSAGGTLLQGDVVTGGSFADGRLLSISTDRLGTDALQARQYIIATGKYFSRGLVAGMDGSVKEPVFGLDVDFNPDRSAWFSPAFADAQPFLAFGVKTAEDGCALRSGRRIVNLRPAGELLSGVVFGSEAVTASALAAADAVIQNSNEL